MLGYLEMFLKQVSGNAWDDDVGCFGGCFTDLSAVYDSG